MDKTWKCGGCGTLYFTRPAVIKHIAEQHNNDSSVKPLRTRPATKAVLPSPKQDKSPRRAPQVFFFVRTNTSAQNLSYQQRSEGTVVESVGWVLHCIASFYDFVEFRLCSILPFLLLSKYLRQNFQACWNFEQFESHFSQLVMCVTNILTNFQPPTSEMQG